MAGPRLAVRELLLFRKVALSVYTIKPVPSSLALSPNAVTLGGYSFHVGILGDTIHLVHTTQV